MSTREGNRVNIFQQLGVKPVVNACGIYTDLGGSVLSPTVWSAMEESNRHFVSMVELLEQSGQIIAGLLGSEAARVTAGASAAIALGVAACMTGMDGSKWESLPDTTGMKNEVLIQRRHRYKYDRCARLTGAKLIEAGDDSGTTVEQLLEKINSQTAVILFPAHLDGTPGTVSLRGVASLARDNGVPTLVDAAYLNYPTDLMGSFCAAGADLTCFSAKYFWGPNSGGFICGRKDLVDVVAGIDFTKFESGPYRTFGRPFKLDRQIVVGVVMALQEWLSMDHAARWVNYRRNVQTIMRDLRSIPGISLEPMCFTMDERLVPEPVNSVVITFNSERGDVAQGICDALADANPRIATVVHEGRLVVAMDAVLDGEVRTIVDGLKAALKTALPVAAQS